VLARHVSACAPAHRATQNNSAALANLPVEDFAYEALPPDEVRTHVDQSLRDLAAAGIDVSSLVAPTDALVAQWRVVYEALGFAPAAQMQYDALINAWAPAFNAAVLLQAPRGPAYRKLRLGGALDGYQIVSEVAVLSNNADEAAALAAKLAH
jgi:hypothetical protein